MDLATSEHGSSTRSELETATFEKCVSGAKRYSPGYVSSAGRPTEIMPFILSRGYDMMSPEDLLERRLAGDVYLRSQNVPVGVALPNPDASEIKLVKGSSPLLYVLGSDTPLNQGALMFDKDAYDKHDGLVLSKASIYALLEDPHALPELRRQVWAFLAEKSKNKNLALDYEADVKETLGLEFNDVMGIGVPGGKGLRLLVIGGYDPLHSYSRRSDAGFHYNLNDPNTTLVVVERSLESKLQDKRTI